MNVLRNCFVTFLPVILASSLSGAALNVWVYSTKGRPVENVSVSIQTVDARVVFTPQRFITNNQGGVSFTVPAGEYTVCTTSSGKPFLDPCDWDIAQSFVAVPASDERVLKKLTLLDGIPFRVRLRDPGKLIARGKSKKQTSAEDDPHVEFGLSDSTGHYHPIPEVSGDDDGSNYELLVPIDADLKLAASGFNVEVLTRTGSVAETVTLKSRPVDLAQTKVFDLRKQSKK